MKVVTVVGARPQFIKCAPVSRELRKQATEILVHTGQHYDDNMSEVFFRELEIPRPDYHLDVGSGSHGRQTGEMLAGIEEVLFKEGPDVVLVYGDTNTTLAGALAAAKLHVRIAHVEAGLRSFNKRMPEEINRVLTDHIAELLFCPTGTSVDNLAREGITKGVHLVGDVMRDSVRFNLRLAEKGSRILQELQLAPGSYALATVHRAENTDDPERLRSIFRAFDLIAGKFPVVVPLHPRTRRLLETSNVPPARARIVEPVSYLDMLLLEKNARVVLTDSGGVQKEAYWFDVPCVTLRQETEWIETLQGGRNCLVGADTAEIVKAALRWEQVPFEKRKQPDLGEGAAGRVVEILLNANVR